MEKSQFNSFADIAANGRKVKETFFNQINTLIDWRPIEQFIRKHYKPGNDAVGRPSYSGLILFKITLLQTWYNLSDYEVEDQVNDRISFSRFVGLSMGESVPDHSVISRFRTAMTKAKAYDKLLNKMNKQLSKHNILVHTGVIVDASITDSPRKPKGKKEYEIVEDRKEDDVKETSSLQQKFASNVDTDGGWTKKRNQLRYGYKQHTAVDPNGLVVAVTTTSANESDTKNLKGVLDKIRLLKGTTVEADKGYKSAANDELLREKFVKNRIMRKAVRNKPLTFREGLLNKAISRTRYKVERTFGGIKLWFGGGVARYVGIEKMHTQHLMQAIAYNLYRSPGIVMSKCLN